MGRRWVYRPGHPKANQRGFVAWEDLGPPAEVAVNAPILSGRFYENTALQDGSIVNSRRQYKNYMERKGVTSSSDYSPEWFKKKRDEIQKQADTDRREAITRAVWQEFEGAQRRHR